MSSTESMQQPAHEASHELPPGVRHVFDGIPEMDNHLPNWWLLILWTTIFFGFGYWYYYHVAEMGPGQWEAYNTEAAEQARRAAEGKPASDEVLLALAKDDATVQQGQQQFQQQCSGCHGAQAQGLIGPNLTDSAWLHGAQPMDLHKVVTEGVVAKGMPAWGRTLGPTRVRAVVAWLLTVKGTNVLGKAPEGEPVP